MAQDLEKLVVQMSADFKQYERGLAKAQQTTVTALRKIERDAQSSVTRVEASVSKIGDAFKGFGRGLLAGAGIAGISEIGRTITDAVAQTAKLGDLAERIGLGTDALQALQLGAVQADLSFEDMNKTLLRFSKTLGETANGQGDYLKTLRANDQTLKGSFLGNLEQLADLVANAKNEQEALLIVTQAMGKGSDGWLEVLRDGAQGIKNLGIEAQTTGAIIDEALIKEAQKLDDRWAELMNQLGVYTKTFAIEAASTIGALFANAQKISDSLKNGDVRGFLFGHEGGLSGSIGDFLLGPEAPQSSAVSNVADKGDRLATKGKTTKVANPEEEAKKRKALADALREEKKARDELTRSIEQEFNAFTRNLTQVDEQTAALRLDAQTIGQTTGEIERQRIAQELLNDAQREGIAINDGLSEVIQQKAKAYGDAAQAVENLRKEEAQAADINDSVKESAKSFVDDIRAGIAPIDAMTNALGRLADRLLDLALDGIFDKLLQVNQNGGGGIGALLASILHTGGTVGGGGSRRAVSPLAFAGAPRFHSGGFPGLRPGEIPSILKRGEIVLPNMSALRSAAGGGRGNPVQINVSNPPGTKTEQRQRQEGGMTIVDIINVAVDKRLASPTTDRLFQAKFGITPSVKRR